MFDFFLTDKSQEAAEESESFNPAAVSPEELKKFVNNKSKLNWLNNKYIRHLPIERAWEEARPFLEKNAVIAAETKKDPERTKHVFDTLRVYLDTLQDAIPYMLELLKKTVNVEAGEAEQMLKAPEAAAVISTFADLVKTQTPSEPAEFTALMKTVGEKTGAKGKSLFMTIRVAATGSTHGLELPTLFAIIGCDEILKRIVATTKEIGAA